MVGLSVVLEAKNSGVIQKSSQVINKTTMMVSKTSTSSKVLQCSVPVIPFLERCFLCGRRLSPGKDIYMYKGDRAFCSVKCRCRQIFMDEETLKEEYCSFAAMKPASASSASSSASSASTTSASRHSKSARSRADASAY